MSKFLTIVFIVLLHQLTFAATQEEALRTAKNYLSTALQDPQFGLHFPKIYQDALKIHAALNDSEPNLKTISCKERSFGLTTAEDSQGYRNSGHLQFRICEKHWLNSNEEVASTIIHEMSHLVAEVHDEIEASMNEIIIVSFGGGFPGLSYLQEDFNEENFESLIEVDEFAGLKEIGLASKKDFLYYIICGYARYNYPNKLRGLLKRLSSEDREYMINSQHNKPELSPLMIAAREGFLEPLKVLLEFGAQKKLKSKNGKTALELAAAHKKNEIASLLME